MTPVAMKLAKQKGDRTSLADIGNELRVLRKLRHPHIDSGRDFVRYAWISSMWTRPEWAPTVRPPETDGSTNESKRLTAVPDCRHTGHTFCPKKAKLPKEGSNFLETTTRPKMARVSGADT